MPHQTTPGAVGPDERSEPAIGAKHHAEDSGPALERLLLRDVNASDLEQSAHSRSLYSGVKRAVDIALVLLATPATVIILAIGAIAIAILMGRPIFFVQNRTGRNGRIFRMVKLRTMKSSPAGGSTATAAYDPRITPLGRFLRRSHIDELPQLWNILAGHMTLIGPRPEQPNLVALYRSVIPHYDLRHLVTPGLSGWAQVSFGYAANVQETRNKLEYDLYYIKHFGPALDFRIVVRTILVYSNPSYVR